MWEISAKYIDSFETAVCNFGFRSRLLGYFRKAVPISHLNCLQIANYGIGGHYQSHQDPMFVYKDPEFLVYSVENKNGRPPYVTGDRLATFMLYLSEVPLGGWTAFPRLGVAIAPTKGSAVFWYNLKLTGRKLEESLHAACPTLFGIKWGNFSVNFCCNTTLFSLILIDSF